MSTAYVVMRSTPATYWEPGDEEQIGPDWPTLTKAEIAMESAQERHPYWSLRIAIIDDNGDEVDHDPADEEATP